MAGYNKYDPKLETLVVETRTFFDPELEKEIQAFDATLDEPAGEAVDTHTKLAQAAHRSAEQASRIHYERAHTGFTREITVTREDLERLFDDVISTTN